MAKKPSPDKPAPSSLLPGFQHLIPSAAAAPLAAHIRPLFLPDLVQQIARNKQIDANRREQAHPVFRKWAKDLKQGVLHKLSSRGDDRAGLRTLPQPVLPGSTSLA